MVAFITNARALSALNDIVDALDPSGLLRIYDNTDTTPADADASLGTNVLLAELPLSATAFGAAADDNPGALATANSITDEASAPATGTATFFRLVTSGGTAIIQGAVGTSGSDLNLTTTAIVTGQPVSVTSLTVRLPESIGG